MSEKRDVVGLMKAVGGGKTPSWNPIPAGQHRWQIRPGCGPLHRMWSWLVEHTINWGHDSIWAVDKDGNELHIEACAAALGMDVANARRTWRAGERLGIWRRGTSSEGRRKLIICGRVKAAQTEVSGSTVCTDLFKILPKAVVREIRSWPEERQQEFGEGWKRRIEIHDMTLRELVSGTREVLGDDDSKYLQSFGLELKRQEHKPKGASPAQLEARRKRFESIQPQLSKFVQNIEELVHSQESTPHKAAKVAAQTPAIEAQVSTGKGDSSPAGRQSLKRLETTKRKHSSSLDLPVSGATGQDDVGVSLTGKTPGAEKATAHEDVAYIAKLIDELVGIYEEDAADQIIRACRIAAPECTLTEIEVAVRSKGPDVKNKPRPIAILITGVPKLFAGDGLRRMRAKQQEAATEAARVAERASERAESMTAEQIVEDRAARQWVAMSQEEQTEMVRIAVLHLAATDPTAWKLLTNEQRYERAVTAARAHVRDQIDHAAV